MESMHPPQHCNPAAFVLLTCKLPNVPSEKVLVQQAMQPPLSPSLLLVILSVHCVSLFELKRKRRGGSFPSPSLNLGVVEFLTPIAPSREEVWTVRKRAEFYHLMPRNHVPVGEALIFIELLVVLQK